MPVSLNNVATSDEYTDAASLRFPDPSKSVTTSIYNNPVFVSFVLLDRTEQHSRITAYDWSEVEFYLTMASWNWSPQDFGGLPVGGVRARSAVSGKSALVTFMAG